MEYAAELYGKLIKNMEIMHDFYDSMDALSEAKSLYDSLKTQCEQIRNELDDESQLLEKLKTKGFIRLKSRLFGNIDEDVKDTEEYILELKSKLTNLHGDIKSLSSDMVELDRRHNEFLASKEYVDSHTHLLSKYKKDVLSKADIIMKNSNIKTQLDEMKLNAERLSLDIDKMNSALSHKEQIDDILRRVQVQNKLTIKSINLNDNMMKKILFYYGHIETSQRYMGEMIEQINTYIDAVQYAQYATTEPIDDLGNILQDINIKSKVLADTMDEVAVLINSVIRSLKYSYKVISMDIEKAKLSKEILSLRMNKLILEQNDLKYEQLG